MDEEKLNLNSIIWNSIEPIQVLPSIAQSCFLLRCGTFLLVLCAILHLYLCDISSICLPISSRCFAKLNEGRTAMRTSNFSGKQEENFRYSSTSRITNEWMEHPLIYKKEILMFEKFVSSFVFEYHELHTRDRQGQCQSSYQLCAQRNNKKLLPEKSLELKPVISMMWKFFFF